jgi:hypothetical protein
MSNETDPSSLARRLLFRELDFNVIARVSGAAVTREMPAGTILFSQSNEPTQVHFIVSGVVKLSQSTENGPRFVLTYRGPGSLLGCLAVFGSKPHVYTALAVKDTCVLSWTAAGFEGCRCLRKYSRRAIQRVREFAGPARYGGRLLRMRREVPLPQRSHAAYRRSDTIASKKHEEMGNESSHSLVPALGCLIRK